MTVGVRKILFVLGCFLLGALNQTVLLAQTELPSIYFCVDPVDEEKTPYLIEFWDSIVFGIMIPEDATVTAHANTYYSAALYTINTSAKTGGYLTMEDLGTLHTETRVSATNPCLNSETRAIFEQLPYQTIPMPISLNHAFVVQQERTDELDNPFQRVISFTFGVGGEGDKRNLQVIQVGESDPFLNFRYFDLEPNTPFMVIANKDFGIGQSLPATDPPEFSRERPSDIRSFVKSDLEDLYGLDIFSLAAESKARIFISSGLLDTYRGTYIRISLAPDTVERIPPLEPGALIRALPDARASFIAIEQVGENNFLQLDLPYETSPRGQVAGESVYRVVEINDLTGQLIIEYEDNPVVVQSWLIEAVSGGN